MCEQGEQFRRTSTGVTHEVRFIDDDGSVTLRRPRQSGVGTVNEVYDSMQFRSWFTKVVPPIITDDVILYWVPEEMTPRLSSHPCFAGRGYRSITISVDHVWKENT